MQDLTSFPDLLWLDGGRYNDSYTHWYEGKTYRLFWADHPKKEEPPLVYLLSADRTEASRVYDEALEAAVAGDWWAEREYRIQNIGRDEVYFPPRTPPVTAAPSGLFAGGMMAQAGGGDPLLPQRPSGTWTCPVCGHGGNTGSFCTECGGKRP